VHRDAHDCFSAHKNLTAFCTSPAPMLRVRLVRVGCWEQLGDIGEASRTLFPAVVIIVIIARIAASAAICVTLSSARPDSCMFDQRMLVGIITLNSFGFLKHHCSPALVKCLHCFHKPQAAPLEQTEAGLCEVQKQMTFCKKKSKYELVHKMQINWHVFLVLVLSHQTFTGQMCERALQGINHI